MKKTSFVLTIVLCLILGSCYYHNWETMNPVAATPPPCILPDSVSYSRDIVPILTTNCGISGTQAASCHGSGGLGSNFSSYQHFAGNTSADSTNNVYLDITWAPNALHTMPKGASKMDPCTINKIIRWMDQGSKNN
ncbi:MAG: hypothetical protein JST67_00860 [Bacteroidetes bacterium]|nr:hypothetical protein [Bacteroidota bacterium]